MLSAAGTGWWWGFGYFLAGLWWLGSAFLVDADEFLWAMPLGVIGLPAALALFHAAGFAIARLLWMSGPGRILSFAFGLGLAEWLRGHIFTGFPWNQFGQSLGDYLITAQAASVVGVEGLGLFALLVFSTPALMVGGVDGRLRTRPVIVAVIALFCLAAFGAVRLSLSGGLSAQLDKAHTVEGVRLRIVQPNIAIASKKDAINGQALLEGYLRLSDKAASPGAAGIGDATHVIWPESPFPFLLAQQPQALKMIGAAMQGKVTLITGAIRADPGVERATPRYYNAIQVVAPDSSITQSYDKVHLVPFGEYLPAPFRLILTSLGLRQFVHIPWRLRGGASSAGRSRSPVCRLLSRSSATRQSSLTRFRHRAAARPSSSTSPTMHGSGRPSAPISISPRAGCGRSNRGLPLIRAANTGISAVIDPYGRILSQRPVGVADVIDSPLPRAIAPTIHSVVRPLDCSHSLARAVHPV